MKATYAVLPDLAPARKPFVIKKISRPYFSKDFHFHTECQLVYILSGSGTRFIGHSVEQFEAGDLTFVGPNVPHVWYSESTSEQKGGEAISLALYLNPGVVCEHLSTFIDTKELSQFFKESERGIKIDGKKKLVITGILQQMLDQKNVALLASFLNIMDQLLDPTDLTWLNMPNPISSYTGQTPGRVPKLMQYIHENFMEDITLEAAASVAGLQIHSFCRFFKSLTNRTFSEFVNDVRVGFACKLLQQSDLSVSQIALECGYNNISYFNRSFKKIKNISPKEYRNSYENNNDEGVPKTQKR